MGDVIHGRVLVAGGGEGELLVSSAPLSFWGGYDHQTGEIIDRRHPLSGEIASGRVLAIPHTVGSSTTTAVLLEAIRAGTAPAAILVTGQDSFLALASIVADEIYRKPITIISLTDQEFAQLRSGVHAKVSPDGTVEIG